MICLVIVSLVDIKFSLQFKIYVEMMIICLVEIKFELVFFGVVEYEIFVLR